MKNTPDSVPVHPGQSAPNRDDAKPQPADKAVAQHVFFSLCWVLGWAIAIVVATACYDGVSLATRAATDLCLPFGLLWLGMIALTIICFRVRAFRLGSIALALLLLATVSGNGWVSGTAISLVEWPETPVSATRDQPYRVAIVLGGGAWVSPSGTPELRADGERIASAAQLWHAGLVQTILCTGSDATGQFHPQDLGLDLLVSLGVPERVIYRVDGENTSQEMKSLEQFFASPPETFPQSGPSLLITSAFHMRRAMRLAESRGLSFDPHPTSFRSGPARFTPSMIIPSAPATDTLGKVLKEYLAGLVGR